MTFPNCFCILYVHCCGFCSIVSEVSQGPDKDVLKCLTPQKGGGGEKGVFSLEVPLQQGSHFSLWRLVPNPQPSEARISSQNTAPISGGQGPYCPLWHQPATPGTEATNPAATHHGAGSVGCQPLGKHRNPPQNPSLVLKFSSGH